MTLVQHCLNGFVIGSIYILMSLGLTMIYGVLRVLHFAHGLVVAVGAYVGWWLGTVSGLPFVIALMGAIIVAALTGMLIERFAYRPLGNPSPLVILIVGVGLSIMVEDLLIHLAGSERQSVAEPLTTVWHWQGLTLTGVQLMNITITLGLLGGLALLIRYTRFGLAMRAVAAGRETSRLMGVDVNRVSSFTFLLGSALAGAAGLLVALEFKAFEPALGAIAGEKAFAVVVMGGLGSMTGTVIAGLSLGLVESLMVGYFQAPLERDAIAFIALITFLILRPTGIVSRGEEQRA